MSKKRNIRKVKSRLIQLRILSLQKIKSKINPLNSLKKLKAK